MKSFTYLLIDIGCILIPFLASFYAKHSFSSYWKAFLKANILVAIPFLLWDGIFTTQGIWGFNPDYLTGFYLGNLPIEEVLFFICIPYACTFTYFAFIYLFPSDPFKKYESVLFLLWLAVSMLFVIVGWDQKYTFFTGLFNLVFLLFCYYFNVKISYIVLTYVAIWPFFIASNGLLTGSYLDEAIVWYNDIENFGVKILTIPIEDSMYGFLLIALNIYFFKVFSGLRPRTLQVGE